MDSVFDSGKHGHHICVNLPLNIVPNVCFPVCSPKSSALNSCFWNLLNHFEKYKPLGSFVWDLLTRKKLLKTVILICQEQSYTSCYRNRFVSAFVPEADRQLCLYSAI